MKHCIKAVFNSQEDMENAFKYFSSRAEYVDQYANGKAALIGNRNGVSDATVITQQHFHMSVSWYDEYDEIKTKGIDEESIVKTIANNNGQVTIEY